MNLKTQRFLVSEIAFFFLWWTSVIITAFAYGREVAQFNISAACQTADIAAFLAHISPKYWFGIFTIGLTIWGGVLVFRKLCSLYPKLTDIRWLVVLFIIAFLLLLPLTGCK